MGSACFGDPKVCGVGSACFGDPNAFGFHWSVCIIHMRVAAPSPKARPRAQPARPPAVAAAAAVAGAALMRAIMWRSEPALVPHPLRLTCTQCSWLSMMPPSPTAGCARRGGCRRRTRVRRVWGGWVGWMGAVCVCVCERESERGGMGVGVQHRPRARAPPLQPPRCAQGPRAASLPSHLHAPSSRPQNII